MIPVNPHLFLRRLVVVTHSGIVAYDEKFHAGVNIIRGQNSSGKSTIANFIFYSLGGDYTSWTAAAEVCRDVYAEVDINGAVITLARTINQFGNQGMRFFWGPYQEAITDALNWKSFPYRQTEKTISFSRVLFGALQFPEVRAEDSAITMHQVLRLLYVDQDTPAQDLFRTDSFDVPLTRETTAEVLLGLYDDSLYGDRLALRSSEKEYESKQSKFEAIIKINELSSTGGTSVEQISREIEVTNQELVDSAQKIVALKEGARVQTTQRTALRSERLQEELRPIKEGIRSRKDQIQLLEVDIVDSELFISSLRKRVDDLSHSLLTRKVLGELPLTHCPQCLSPLELPTNEGQCVLCKQPLTDEAEKSQAKRLRQELELQIKESLSLLSNKQTRLEEYKMELPVLLENGRRLQKELNQAVAESQSTRDERIDDLLVAKGAAEKRIEFLMQKLKTAELLESLKAELASLAATIDRLKREISHKESAQTDRKRSAMSAIQGYTIELLRNDFDRQPEFKTGTRIEVDFRRNLFSLDGRNSFSASSNVYFKNAIHFAMFFSSASIDFFRYPRFILCDNMEDKGMEKERSQNFQELIVAKSSELPFEHQIIFTTSMISDKLENDPQLCIGAHYDENNRSLAL